MFYIFSSTKDTREAKVTEENVSTLTLYLTGNWMAFQWDQEAGSQEIKIINIKKREKAELKK